MQTRETTYSEIVSEEHRKKFCQYFTPPLISLFMCRWIAGIQPLVIFDPAFGLGAFYDAALSILSQKITFRAMEIDPEILSHYFKYHKPRALLAYKIANYLTTLCDQQQAIVCNPPYAVLKPSDSDYEEIRSFFAHTLNIPIRGKINKASAFLLKSLTELITGGRLAYIMPLEFLHTNYGVIVKKHLLMNTSLKAIIRIENECSIFPDVITTVGIILVEKDTPTDYVSFYSIKDENGLKNFPSEAKERQVGLWDLNPEEKWHRFFNETKTDKNKNEEYNESQNISNYVCLGHYGRVLKGIATGANEFFALSLKDANHFNIPTDALVPCICKSNQIKSNIFTEEDFNVLVAANQKTYLLNAPENPQGPLAEYIELGLVRGYSRRFLTESRKIWYRLEQRIPPPIMFAVFFRQKPKVILNKTSCICLTCFHCFYPDEQYKDIVQPLFIFFCSNRGKNALLQNKRIYGKQLYKFEPNDIKRVKVPPPDVLESITPDKANDIITAIREEKYKPEELDSLFNV